MSKERADAIQSIWEALTEKPQKGESPFQASEREKGQKVAHAGLTLLHDGLNSLERIAIALEELAARSRDPRNG